MAHAANIYLGALCMHEQIFTLGMYFSSCARPASPFPSTFTFATVSSLKKPDFDVPRQGMTERKLNAGKNAAARIMAWFSELLRFCSLFARWRCMYVVVAGGGVALSQSFTGTSAASLKSLTSRFPAEPFRKRLFTHPLSALSLSLSTSLSTSPRLSFSVCALTFDDLPPLAEHPRCIQDEQRARHAGVVVLEDVADAPRVRHRFLAATRRHGRGRMLRAQGKKRP